MKKKIDPVKNYHDTREAIGYVPRKQSTQETYERIGFMSGLEVHQQLFTKGKIVLPLPGRLLSRK